MTDEEWHRRTDDRLSEIEKRLEVIERDEAVTAFRWKSVEARLGSIEASQTWVVRLIVGGFITTLVVYALSGGLSLAAGQ